MKSVYFTLHSINEMSMGQVYQHVQHSQ